MRVHVILKTFYVTALSSMVLVVLEMVRSDLIKKIGINTCYVSSR